MRALAVFKEEFRAVMLIDKTGIAAHSRETRENMPIIAPFFLPSKQYPCNSNFTKKFVQ